jgi:hypothetical protein
LRRQDFHHLIVFSFPLLLSLVLVEISIYSLRFLFTWCIWTFQTCNNENKDQRNRQVIW